MTDNSNLTELITTAEAAELAGYHPVHIRRLMREGLIQGRKFGRDWMVNRASVQAYMKKMQELGQAKYDPWRTGARQTDDN